MSSLDDNEEHRGGTWFLRIVSIAGIAALLAVVGMLARKGNLALAIPLIAVIPVLAFVLSRSWTGAIFTMFGYAKRYVEGVEGDGRHEWYAFRCQRVRVFLDANQRPWFAVNDIAAILDMKVDRSTFRHYAPSEQGVPACASENCLSERGLRRLLKYSEHRDAGAFGNWLDREVLRVLRNRNEARTQNTP